MKEQIILLYMLYIALDVRYKIPVTIIDFKQSNVILLIYLPMVQQARKSNIELHYQCRPLADEAKKI